MLADVVYSGEAIRSGYRALDQARYQPIDQTPDDLFHPHLFWRSRKLHFRSLPQFREADHAHAGGLRLHQTGAIPVIQIGCVIGDLIAQVDELGFERRAKSWQIFVQFRELARLEVAGMLHDSLPYLEGLDG